MDDADMQIEELEQEPVFEKPQEKVQEEPVVQKDEQEPQQIEEPEQKGPTVIHDFGASQEEERLIREEAEQSDQEGAVVDSV